MSRKLPQKARILALDVRSNRIGYASFEGHNLLEAGITRLKIYPTARPRLEFLLRKVRPRVLVLRKISKTSSRNCRGTRRILHAAQSIAKRFSVRVAFVTERQIQKRFLAEGASTKYGIALFLVHSFSSLDWRLPPPRKAWEGEHRNMGIFDAVALGMAYLGSKSVFVLASEIEDHIE